MGSESNLRTWVSDKLMSLLGYSQTTVVQYIIGLSKKASSPNDVMGKFLEFGFTSSDETRTFAEEIFSRVPRKSSGTNLYHKQEREAAMLVRKQKTYALLDADDEDDDNGRKVNDRSSDAADSQPKKTVANKKQFRRKTENQEDNDDDEREEERNVRRRISQDEDDASESEEELMQDQREREQLERNIRDRDAAGTRKLTEPKLSRREEEEAVRRSNALEQDDLSTLRKVSREVYLKTREQKKLEEIRDDIEDEQYLFQDVKLTEVEYRELRYKKEIYELAKKHTEEADDTNEYRMPEAYDDQDGGVNQEKRFAVAMQRYKDSGSGEKMNPFAEQEAWEEHQIGSSLRTRLSSSRHQLWMETIQWGDDFRPDYSGLGCLKQNFPQA